MKLIYRAAEGSQKKVEGKYEKIKFLISKANFHTRKIHLPPHAMTRIFNVYEEVSYLAALRSMCCGDSYVVHQEMQQQPLMGILMQTICLKKSCAPCHSFIYPFSLSI